MAKPMTAVYRPQDVNVVFRGPFAPTQIAEAVNLAGNRTTKSGDMLLGDGKGHLVTGDNLLSQMAERLTKAQKEAVGLKVVPKEGVDHVVLEQPDKAFKLLAYSRTNDGKPSFTKAEKAVAEPVKNEEPAEDDLF